MGSPGPTNEDEKAWREQQDRPREVLLREIAQALGLAQPFPRAPRVCTPPSGAARVRAQLLQRAAAVAFEKAREALAAKTPELQRAYLEKLRKEELQTRFAITGALDLASAAVAYIPYVGQFVALILQFISLLLKGAGIAQGPIFLDDPLDQLEGGPQTHGVYRGCSSYFHFAEWAKQRNIVKWPDGAEGIRLRALWAADFQRDTDDLLRAYSEALGADLLCLFPDRWQRGLSDAEVRLFYQSAVQTVSELARAMVVDGTVPGWNLDPAGTQARYLLDFLPRPGTEGFRDLMVSLEKAGPIAAEPPPSPPPPPVWAQAVARALFYTVGAYHDGFRGRARQPYPPDYETAENKQTLDQAHAQGVQDRQAGTPDRYAGQRGLGDPAAPGPASPPPALPPPPPPVFEAPPPEAPLWAQAALAAYQQGYQAGWSGVEPPEGPRPRLWAGADTYALGKADAMAQPPRAPRPFAEIAASVGPHTATQAGPPAQPTPEQVYQKGYAWGLTGATPGITSPYRDQPELSAAWSRGYQQGHAEWQARKRSLAAATPATTGPASMAPPTPLSAADSGTGLLFGGLVGFTLLGALAALLASRRRKQRSS